MLKFVDPEALIWASGLLVVALGNPESAFHFTLFLPDLLLDIRSPGYNLGHSIAFLFRGDITNSIQAHWLGIPATVILLLRIVSLERNKFLTSERGTSGHA